MKSDEKWWKVMKSDEKWWKVMKSDEKWWKMMKNDEDKKNSPIFAKEAIFAVHYVTLPK